MDFQEAVKTCFEKYVQFEGRASRPEYWWFVLAGFLTLVAATVLDHLLLGSAVGPIYVIALLGLFIPSLAAQIRRLHDTNRSGWWLLLSLVPFVGGIIVLIWLCEAGTAEANTYGPPPVARPTDPHQPKPASIFRAPQSDLERLEKLHALHGSGALTPEEFASEKAKLLNR